MVTLTAPDAVSMDSQKLDHVKQLFHQQIADGLHPGAGLAVYRYGHLVLDIFGGVTDSEPVTSGTMFVLMSSTKPLTASCLYMLKERGKIAYDDLVSKYWPEFAQNGKETVTIRHILTHRGGFPETPKSLPSSDWPDWSKVTRAMEQAPTIYTPGETMAYHPINYGWVIAEIVRRVDGRTFDRFIAEELTAPLGMDNTYVGLPAGLEGRVSPMHKMEDDADPSGYSATFSQPPVWRSIVPGAAGVATAGDLARFYAMMERQGSLDGATVVQTDTVAEAVALQVEGTDQSLGAFAQRSLGLALADERMGRSAGSPLNTFGHGGAGTSIGWADHDSGLAVGYITNGFRGNVNNNARLAAISQSIRDACV
ncbi:MAG: serine hydrolase [Chloroflexi bacterium]|nr:serine hydrolase [Chloroflexota bacterium]MDA1270624.1 serine hydrolase [Chloroflexota bacterium]